MQKDCFKCNSSSREADLTSLEASREAREREQREQARRSAQGDRTLFGWRSSLRIAWGIAGRLQYHA